MQIAKLIKKPIGSTQITYYVTINGQTLDDAIDHCLGVIARSSHMYIPEGENPEEILRTTLSDEQFEYLLQNHVMGRVSPFVLRDEGDLDMAFEPECTSDEMPEKGKDFTFEIHVLKRPKGKLTSTEPVEVKVPVYKVPDEAIDLQIDQLAQMATTFKALKDDGKPVELGQVVRLDMACKEGDEELPGISGEDRTLELNYNYMPQSFIDQIVGMTVGETKSFNFEAPYDTAEGEQSNSYSATVTIKEKMKKMVPRISNAWVEVNIPEAGNLEGLRTKIREDFEQQVRQQADTELGTMVDEAIGERYEGQIYDELYETAANGIMRQMRSSLEQQGMSLQDFMDQQGMDQQQFNMQVMIDARGIIRQGLALDKLYHELFDGQELTDEDMEQAYTAFAPGNEEEAKQQFAENGRGYAVVEVAKRLKAHKWLMDTAKVEYVEVDVPAEAFIQQIPMGMNGAPVPPVMG